MLLEGLLNEVVEACLEEGKRGSVGVARKKEGTVEGEGWHARLLYENVFFLVFSCVVLILEYSM